MQGDGTNHCPFLPQFLSLLKELLKQDLNEQLNGQPHPELVDWTLADHTEQFGNSSLEVNKCLGGGGKETPLSCLRLTTVKTDLNNFNSEKQILI